MLTISSLSLRLLRPAPLPTPLEDYGRDCSTSTENRLKMRSPRRGSGGSPGPTRPTSTGRLTAFLGAGGGVCGGFVASEHACTHGSRRRSKGTALLSFVARSRA